MRLSYAVSLALMGAVHAAVSTISAYGNKFFYENGTQFFLKGVAYQLTEDDPLVDSEQCARDAALMRELGANSIRVYHVDASKDHSDCMSTLADAGIYLLVDLDTFDTYILPTSPWWNQTQYERFTEVIDEFQKYDNTLGFFVGNEVIAQASQSLAAPFIKAAARDMKAYRNSKGYRNIPVGYSAADIAELRPMLQDFLTCGGNDSDTIDFFSLNSYEWCGEVDYQTSGYSNLEAGAANFPVPIFFSETGCNTVRPRTFEDQAAIFGKEMINDWSGSIIYEWIEETNDYGLISYGAPADPTATGSNIVAGYTRQGTPTPVSPDFSNLKAQWATLNPTGIMSSDMDTKSLSTRSCPASSTGTAAWLPNGDVQLPTVGETLFGTTYTTSVPSGAVPSNGAPVANSTSGSASATSSSKSPASPNTQITKMTAALLGLLLSFTLVL
ncbi:beta (1-3) glucanosyltransferase [Diaporthe amygdali]|uniref:beta (1-3) glucanosyltransferase n=1 Tax=Phomopsis amygdali TaxID=1214568 RepID=UPI0022FE0D60|nr:beta (1-3) glucanosyltransferase [Diaporthe amygdali]KAJ0124979.1 beta (1-3) glucanosyltransferase [Diaporthe amygdali]